MHDFWWGHLCCGAAADWTCSGSLRRCLLIAQCTCRGQDIRSSGSHKSYRPLAIICMRWQKQLGDILQPSKSPCDMCTLSRSMLRAHPLCQRLHAFRSWFESFTEPCKVQGHTCAGCSWPRTQMLILMMHNAAIAIIDVLLLWSIALASFQMRNFLWQRQCILREIMDVQTRASAKFKADQLTFALFELALAAWLLY